MTSLISKSGDIVKRTSGVARGPLDWAEQLQRFDILDVHHHLGSLARISASYAGASTDLDGYGFEQDRSARLAVMDHNGIDSALVLPASSFPEGASPQAARQLNDAVAEYCSIGHDRFPAGLGTVALSNVDEALKEVERLSGELGLRGVVWHHRMQGAFIDHTAMAPILSRMQELRLPAFVHTLAESNLEAIWRLELIALQFPNVPFVALGAFSNHSQCDWVLAIARRAPNIYFETGALFPVAHSLDPFVNEFGDDRLIFGSDYYVSPPTYFHAAPLFEILAAPWPDQTKAKILGGNARRLLGLS